MKTNILIILLFLLTSSPRVLSETNPEQFEFRETVAIYHLMDNGGIIYLRPDEYDENQGFIRIYEALDEYLAELDSTTGDVFLNPVEQPILDEFRFVNGSAQTNYFLKDGWIGVGEKWVPISGSDYKKLRSTIDGRKNLDGSLTDADGLADFTARIHDVAQGNPAPTYQEAFVQHHQEKVVSKTVVETHELSHKDSVNKVGDNPEREIAQSASAKVTTKIPEHVSASDSLNSHGLTHGDANIPNNYSTRSETTTTVSGGNGAWIAATIFLLFLVGCFLYFRPRR